MTAALRLIVCGLARSLAGAGLGSAWIASSECGSVGLDWRIAGQRWCVTFVRDGGVEWCRA